MLIFWNVYSHIRVDLSVFFHCHCCFCYCCFLLIHTALGGCSNIKMCFINVIYYYCLLSAWRWTCTAGCLWSWQASLPPECPPAKTDTRDCLVVGMPAAGVLLFCWPDMGRVLIDQWVVGGFFLTCDDFGEDFAKWTSVYTHQFLFWGQDKVHIGSVSWENCGRVLSGEWLVSLFPW